MRLSIILFSIFLFAACKKDDTNEPIKGKITLNTEEGCSFEVSSAGKSETITGTSVILGSGQLLNQSFFRQFNISTSKGTLNLRLSFPSSMIGKVDANMYKYHDLYEYPLDLQNTGNLSSEVAEIFSSSIFAEGNASGIVTLKQNESINGTNYAVYGEAEFSIRGKDNITNFVKGYFWKKTL